MKVGVVFGTELASNGGSHTFVNDIFDSILKLASKTSHTFTILNFQQENDSVLLEKKIDYLSLYPSFKTRWQYRLSVVQKSIFEKLKNPKSKLKQRHWYEKFIVNSLQNNEIDLIWHLVPYCLTLEVPYITTLWDLEHRKQPYFPEVSIQGEWDHREQLYATTLRRAALIFVGTKEGKAEIEQFYQVPSERVRVLPFPTPQFAFNTISVDNGNILEKYNIPKNYLYYPAQFWSHKNHINLLLALKWLKDKYNLVLPIVFSGSDKGNQEYVQQMSVKLNLSQQVYFLGFLPQEDLISLYRNAFALTFVSFFGPDNLPPLEAFALGCPVIASNISGAQEQLGDAALLVDPKNPEHIALAIKSLWDNTNLRQTLVQKGLVRASQWTGEDYVKEVFSILDDFAAIRRCWSLLPELQAKRCIKLTRSPSRAKSNSAL